MPYIRLTILTILTPIFLYSSYEYTENGKFDYYNAVKHNKETMLNILYLSNELDKYKNLFYCSDLEYKYKYKYKLYHQNFLDTVFMNPGTTIKYDIKYRRRHKYGEGYYYKNIGVLYNDSNDFSFCIIKEHHEKIKDSNFFKYILSDVDIYPYKKCKDGYRLSSNRMFEIKDDNFIYCEKEK